MPKRTRFIPLSKVREGQKFRHYGNLYRRALEKETEKHPARELCAAQKKPTILAYSLEGGRKVPLSFVCVEDDGRDIKVIVAQDGGDI